MGQARGTVTQEELEKYGGANIMLMNTSGVQSGVAGGDITWGIYWTSNGITNSGTWCIDILRYYGANIPETDDENAIATAAATFLDGLNSDHEKGYLVHGALGGLTGVGYPYNLNCLFER